jgi:4-aminobutyrate aminotransferase/4-aminobutyrate aminotransferase/(S)-3-amino-2-methylpropionate transaminase
MSVTGLEMWRTDSNPLPGIHFLPRAHCQRCAFEREPDRCAFPCVEAIERIIVDAGPENLAGLIAEPIQGNGGIVVPPDGYWQHVRALCDRFGLLLIFDEIQTGMNRTGTWFAAEHWECVPDIVTMAKALGNGMPIAATLASGELAAAYARPGASTFGGNPVSCAAALATLDVHEQQHLGERARDIGADLQDRLAHAASMNPHLKHVRGKGLMLGVEVVNSEGKADPARCDHYLEILKDRGFLLGKTGSSRNVLTLMPPLTLTMEQAALIGSAVATL